jgi:peroxiredoxin
MSTLDDNLTTGSTTRPDWRVRTRRSGWGTLLVLGVTAALVLAGAYLVQKPRSAQASGVTAVSVSGAAAPPKVGQVPPDFTAVTADGRKVSLSSLKGKPVWLSFGASWCAACRAEAPDIRDASQRASASGLVVVQVFLSDDAATVRDYGKRLGLGFDLVPDPQTQIAAAYGVYGIPVHYFIGRDGVLHSARTGSMSPSTMDKALAAISG